MFGFFRAVLEEHLPVTLVNDWNLTPEDLAGYKVLVLPNAACLDDRQCDAVRAFVARGGGVVASLDTGLCDEFGTPRKTPALADVLGVNHKGTAVAGKVGETIDENFAHAAAGVLGEAEGRVGLQAEQHHGLVPRYRETDRAARPGRGDVQGSGRASNRGRARSSRPPCARRAA